MLNQTAKKIVAMSLAVTLGASLVMPEALAQEPSPEEKVELTGTRRQLATIVFAGLSGAILGLSTLSFYGRPQDHLSNIAVGFAVGIIGGTVYTTYKAATKPYEAYDISGASTRGSNIWAGDSERSNWQMASYQTPKLTWSWEF